MRHDAAPSLMCIRAKLPLKRRAALGLISPPLHGLRRWLLHAHAHRRHSIRRHAHSIRMAVVVEVADEICHGHPADTLRLRHRAVLVCEKHRLEVDNLLTELRDLSRESIVLCAEKLHLRLQVGKPLLLSLTTLEGSNSVKTLE